MIWPFKKRDARSMIDRYRDNPPRHTPGRKVACFDSPIIPGVWNVRSDHECDALTLTSPTGKSAKIALFSMNTPALRDHEAHVLETTLRVLA